MLVSEKKIAHVIKVAQREYLKALRMLKSKNEIIYMEMIKGAV
jgi:hypothetical protein